MNQPIAQQTLPALTPVPVAVVPPAPLATPAPINLEVAAAPLNPIEPNKKTSKLYPVFVTILILVIIGLVAFIFSALNKINTTPTNVVSETETESDVEMEIEEVVTVQKDIYFSEYYKLNNIIESSSNSTFTDGRLSIGVEGSGDVKSVSHPSILKVGDEYKLWYEGADANGVVRIYHATSTDGVNWRKYDNSIPANSDTTSTNGRIALGTAGTGDSLSVNNATVLYIDDEYKMWYCGNDGKHRRVFHATSTDSLTWEKVDNSIPLDSDTTSTNGRIPNGTTGKFDNLDACAPEILFDEEDNMYKLWYSSVDPGYIGMATSEDGLTWTKVNNEIPEDSNTVSTEGRIGNGLPDSADSKYVRNASVVKTEGQYHMWYVIFGDQEKQGIGYATSKDGLTWMKYDNSTDIHARRSNGLTGEGTLYRGSVGTADENGFGAPDALYEDGKLTLLYFGFDVNLTPRILTAVSNNGDE